MADGIGSANHTLRIARVLGILVCLTAALLLFLDAIESGWAIVILIIGIGLITTSGVTAGTGSKR
jgi:hypothetical protein